MITVAGGTHGRQPAIDADPTSKSSASRSSGDDSDISGGILRITQDIDHKNFILYEVKRDLRSHWLDLRFQVRFRSHPTGWIKAGLDGKQVVDFSGITANPESAATGYAGPSFFYFKMGLYRGVTPQPMTIYLDEYHKRQPDNEQR
jgi:hypothetical protein